MPAELRQADRPQVPDPAPVEDAPVSAAAGRFCVRCLILFDAINPNAGEGFCTWCVEEMRYSPSELADLREAGQIVPVGAMEHLPMKKLTPARLERLGHLVDKCNNHLAWLNNPAAPAAMKLGALESGLCGVRDEVKALYLELGGTDEWSVPGPDAP